MTSPFIPSSFTYGDAPQGGVLMPMIIAAVNPSNTVNTQYASGYFWLSDLSQGGSGNLYYQGGNSAGVPNWTLVSNSGGALNTLSDGTTTVSPSGGNIALIGTANQITATASGPAHQIQFSLPTAIIAPGSLTTAGNVSVGGNLTVTGTSTFTGGITFSGNVSVGGTLTVTGLTTLGALTQVGTLSLNATGTATTTIGGSSGAMTIAVGAGNFSLTGGGNTVGIANDAAANLVTLGSTTGAASLTLQAGTGNMLFTGATGTTYTMGSTTGTGTITIGRSTAGETVSINSAASIATGNTVNILAGATPGASQTLNIMTGVGTAGTYAVNILTGASTGTTQSVSIATGAAATTVAIGNNTGASALTLTAGTGNVLVNGAVTTTYTVGTSTGTGLMTFGLSTAAQTISIQSAASNTGAQVVNILNGATPGANTTLNIMNGAGTAGTQAIAILSTGATRAGTYNIGDGAAAHTGVIGSTTASASLTLQAGSGTTGLKLSAAGNVQMVPATGSAASNNITLNGRVFQATLTGQTTASAATVVCTITNSAITATTQSVFISVDNLGSNDAQMTIQRVLLAVGSVAVTLKNNGAAALNGDIHVNGWVLN